MCAIRLITAATNGIMAIIYASCNIEVFRCLLQKYQGWRLSNIGFSIHAGPINKFSQGRTPR